MLTCFVKKNLHPKLISNFKTTTLPCVSGIRSSLAWLCWFNFSLEPTSGKEKATQKIVAHVKSGEK